MPVIFYDRIDDTADRTRRLSSALRGFLDRKKRRHDRGVKKQFQPTIPLSLGNALWHHFGVMSSQVSAMFAECLREVSGRFNGCRSDSATGFREGLGRNVNRCAETLHRQPSRDGAGILSVRCTKAYRTGFWKPCGRGFTATRLDSKTYQIGDVECWRILAAPFHETTSPEPM